MKTVRRNKNPLPFRWQLTSPKIIAAFHVERSRILDPICDNTVYCGEDGEVIASGKKTEFRNHNLDRPLSNGHRDEILTQECCIQQQDTLLRLVIYANCYADVSKLPLQRVLEV